MGNTLILEFLSAKNNKTMEITLTPIRIGDLYAGFSNSDEEGVFGYGGKLNIRPKYQREFVYNEKQKVAVIDSIRKGFPLNVMYWVENEDGTYVLTLTSDSEAVISINADGTLDYHHPHIPINAKNYILNISANR